MTQLSKVKQDIHNHTDKSCNQKNQPTCLPLLTHWRGSKLAIWNSADSIPS